MVTEGYRRCRPCHRPTSDAPPSHSRATEACVIYGVLCLRCLKKHCFLRCFGPFGGKGFHLGDVTKPRLLRGFGLQEGAQGGKIGILRSFQHRWPKHGPNIAPKMSQRGQHRPDIGQHRPNIGPTWCQDCLAGARLSGVSL